jgi:hypothetical protein
MRMLRDGGEEIGCGAPLRETCHSSLSLGEPAAVAGEIGVKNNQQPRTCACNRSPLLISQIFFYLDFPRGN